MRHIKRIKPGTLMAFLALFVALGGTAYAAATIGSSHVIDNSLLSRDLKNGAGVHGADVITDSLTGSDVNENSLGTVPKAQTAGSVGNLDYNSASFPNSAHSQDFGSVDCDPGQRAVGGGVFGSSGTDQSVNSSYPAFEGTGWLAFMNNTGAFDASMTVYVICTDAASVSKVKGGDPEKK